MDDISRRLFTRSTVGSLLTYSLLDTLFACDAFAEKVRPVVTRWLSDVNQLGFDLKDKKISQIDWSILTPHPMNTTSPGSNQRMRAATSPLPATNRPGSVVKETLIDRSVVLAVRVSTSS